jgi:hypothetical protein
MMVAVNLVLGTGLLPVSFDKPGATKSAAGTRQVTAVTIRVGEDDRSSCGSGRGRSNNKGVQVVAVMQKKKHKKQTPC